jgi:hypothetical protein
VAPACVAGWRGYKRDLTAAALVIGGLALNVLGPRLLRR